MDYKEFYIEIKRELDILRESNSKILVTQERHTASLEEHMRRTDLLESGLAKVVEKVRPLEIHVAVAGAIAKGIALLASGVGLVSGIITLVRLFRH